MTPVACVQDFSFCHWGPSKFMLGVGSWRSWVPSSVNGESQMSLTGTICQECKIWVGVCRQPCIKWNIPQERQGTSGETCFPHRLPLMTWRPPLWNSFPFLGRITRRYSPCCKIHIGTRHPWRSQNLPEAFPSWHHTSNPQKMCTQTIPFWLHHQ